MIVSKILLSTGFSGLVGYVLSSSKEIEPEQVATRHIFSLSRAASEMELVAARSTRVKDPVAHIIVSWSKDESVDVTRQLKAGHQILAALKLSDHQALIVVHDEPKDGVVPGPNGRHYEMHIVVNRVHPRGTVNNLPHSFKGAERAAKRISESLGFVVVPGRFNGAILDKPGLGKTIGSIQAESGRPTIAQELLANAVSMDRLREGRRKGWPELLAAFAEVGVIIAAPPANTPAARGRAKRGFQRGLVMIDTAERHRRIKISALDSAYEKWGAIALERELGPVPYDKLQSIEVSARGNSSQNAKSAQQAIELDPATRDVRYRSFKIEEAKASEERRQQVAATKLQRSKIYLDAKAESDALATRARLRRKLITAFCGRASLVGAALNDLLDSSMDTRLGEIRARRNAAIATLNAETVRDRISIPRWAEWQRRNKQSVDGEKSKAGSARSGFTSPLRTNPSFGRPIFGTPRYPAQSPFRAAYRPSQPQNTRGR